MRSIRELVSGMRLTLSCVVITCLFASPTVFGLKAEQKSSPTPRDTESIGKSKLSEKPVEVLGGRLTIRMPDGSKKEGRPFAIMAAPEPEEHETRVIFDAGQERLVLMAHELFALAGDDFEKDVKEWVAKWTGKYKVEVLPLAVRELKAVAVVPVNDPDHTRSDDATFAEGVFIQSDDRTIKSLDVYVNAVAEKELKGCKTVAHQILLSVAPGTKILDLAAGERRLFAYSKDLEISVIAPQNTVATKQVGPDFVVHRLIAIGPLGSDSGSILIYIGGHPDYDPGTKKGESMIFGKKVEWQSVPQGPGLQTHCDLPIPGEAELKSHIIILAPNSAQLEALTQAAESLKLVKSRAMPPT
jgi:hypothetical protein